MRYCYLCILSIVLFTSGSLADLSIIDFSSTPNVARMQSLNTALFQTNVLSIIDIPHKITNEKALSVFSQRNQDPLTITFPCHVSRENLVEHNYLMFAVSSKEALAYLHLSFVLGHPALPQKQTVVQLGGYDQWIIDTQSREGWYTVYIPLPSTYPENLFLQQITITLPSSLNQAINITQLLLCKEADLFSSEKEQPLTLLQSFESPAFSFARDLTCFSGCNTALINTIRFGRSKALHITTTTVSTPTIVFVSFFRSLPSSVFNSRVISFWYKSMTPFKIAFLDESTYFNILGGKKTEIDYTVITSENSLWRKLSVHPSIKPSRRYIGMLLELSSSDSGDLYFDEISLSSE